jgi:hypothetical protein
MKKTLAMFALALPVTVIATGVAVSGSPEHVRALATKVDHTTRRDIKPPYSPRLQCEPQDCEWPTIFDPETCGCRF